MTAEGTACNGAGEAPKAEFSPEKAVAAAPPEDKAAGEREGEDVGGPFVIEIVHAATPRNSSNDW